MSTEEVDKEEAEMLPLDRHSQVRGKGGMRGRGDRVKGSRVSVAGLSRTNCRGGVRCWEGRGRDRVGRRRYGGIGLG